jgi:hypothetical protein
VPHTETSEPSAIEPGKECVCSGRNKDCWHCSGTGIVQVPQKDSDTVGGSSAHLSSSIQSPVTSTYRVPFRRRHEVRGLDATCPVCNCSLRSKRLAKHLRKVHGHSTG